MAELKFNDSPFRFTDPIRYFKANDPYYFEVDNIPLKQLQENCLWLKDQLRQVSPELQKVQRADIDELRPYATGSDRLVRVKPGRFTARINDAATKDPLSYLQKIVGTDAAVNEVFQVAIPGAGTFGDGWNNVLNEMLLKFQSSLSADALGMTGLETRTFSWPTFTADRPLDGDGVDADPDASYFKYGGVAVNNPGGSAEYVPAVISQAIVWAKSQNSVNDRFTAFTFENDSEGFTKLPRLESHFVKRWRGVARTAIVDVEDELSIEVPEFDAADFNYIDEDGNEVAVDGVQSRIDLVFIYSKSVDASSADIMKPSGRQTILKPTLGIVRGAGIKASFNPNNVPERGIVQQTSDEHKILASPGDAANTDSGFTATSANDIAFDVRGTFPAPDDILNLAPLLCEKLESEAFELVGQSILPVAYVWVTNEGSELINGATPVQVTDVIDIRPFFRTAELSYNERAGIAAAVPQLSLANPAVGKAQMDYEIYRSHKNIMDLIPQIPTIPNTGARQLATGYVFGGWFFGPEGCMNNYYKTYLDAGISQQEVQDRLGFSRNLQIPNYPDWEIGDWVIQENVPSPGTHAIDRLNMFAFTSDSNVAGSYGGFVTPDGTTPEGGTPEQALGSNGYQVGPGLSIKASCEAVVFKKTIYFDRPPELEDYTVDVSLVGCALGMQNETNEENGGTKWYGNHPANGVEPESWTPGYFGHHVSKGFDSFTIYVFNGFPGSLWRDLYKLHENRSGKANKALSTITVLNPDIERQRIGVNIRSDWEKGKFTAGTAYYPTVSWTMNAITSKSSDYHYTVTDNSESNRIKLGPLQE